MIFSYVSTPDIHVAPWVQILLIFRISLNWSILHILKMQWWDYDQLIVMGVAMQKEEKWDTADAGPQHFWNTSGYISSISLTPGSGNTTWLGLNSASPGVVPWSIDLGSSWLQPMDHFSFSIGNGLCFLLSSSLSLLQVYKNLEPQSSLLIHICNTSFKILGALYVTDGIQEG